MPRRGRLAERRKLLGLSQERLAEVLEVDRSTVARWERGEVDPLAWHRPALAKALEVSAEELALLLSPDEASLPAGEGTADDEVEALELARRVDASDVSAETLGRIEAAFDEMAVAYATTQPGELMARLRNHIRYVSQLMDARKTLRQHRRLLLVGGWLSLLVATVHIDMRQSGQASAWLRTAYQLATRRLSEHSSLVSGDAGVGRADRRTVHVSRGAFATGASDCTAGQLGADSGDRSGGPSLGAHASACRGA